MRWNKTIGNDLSNSKKWRRGRRERGGGGRSREGGEKERKEEGERSGERKGRDVQRHLTADRCPMKRATPVRRSTSCSPIASPPAASSRFGTPDICGQAMSNTRLSCSTNSANTPYIHTYFATHCSHLWNGINSSRTTQVVQTECCVSCVMHHFPRGYRYQ